MRRLCCDPLEEDAVARTLTDEELAEFVHATWSGLYRTAYLILGDAANW
jgi:hypothetical protein